MTTFDFKHTWIVGSLAMLAVVISALSAVPAFAQLASPLILVGAQHVDLEVPIIGGAWDLSVRAWYDGNLPPNQAILYFNSSMRTVRDDWESWIGAEQGGTVWISEQLSVPGEIWLGLAARGCDSLGTWLPDDSRLSVPFQYIQIDLVDVRGYDGDDDPTNNPEAPGDFSLWETNSFGKKIPWFSTAESLADGNRVYMIPGGHTHLNWGFTAEGIYEVDLQPSAYLGPGQTNLSVGPVTTFYFGIERPMPGDANLDGVVDAADAAALAAAWGQSGSEIGWLEGDFDADKAVGLTDAAILAANWTRDVGEASSTPEPGVLALIVVGLAACVAIRPSHAAA